MKDGKRVIVAAVGELEGEDRALLAAAALAKGCGGELHLVHGYELPRFFTMSPELAIGFPEAADAYREGVLEQLETAAWDAVGEGSAVCHAMEGAPGACVLQVAAEVAADLVVVGAARGSKLRRMILGTTAQRVLREADVPVLVVRAPVARPVERLLLTCDLSDLGSAVHEAGLAAVEWLFGRPEAVRSLYVIPWTLVPPPLEQSAMEETVQNQLDDFLRQRTPRGYAVAPELRVGVPAEEIVAAARAWSAELIVVGTHARGWGARLVLGSVAEATLRDAPCNVLAIPPSAAAAGEPDRASAGTEPRELAGAA